MTRPSGPFFVGFGYPRASLIASQFFFLLLLKVRYRPPTHSLGMQEHNQNLCARFPQWPMYKCIVLPGGLFEKKEQSLGVQWR